MDFKGFHIEGKYAVLTSLIAGISVVGASAIQVYKPFSTEIDKLDVVKNKNGLYSAKYIIDKNLEKNIFEEKKKVNFSINSTGKKLIFLEKTPSIYDESLKNIIKIINYDTSFPNEITLHSNFSNGNDGHIGRYECQLKIKGWNDTKSIILNISFCLDSPAFTVGGYSVEKRPYIRTASNYFNIDSAGDYLISFDEFNVVIKISKIR